MSADPLGYITAGLYWCLIACWLIILIFYWREHRRLTVMSTMIGTMLVVVFLDGARTLLESIYFGTWYTAKVGLLPHYLYDRLEEPRNVLIPKFINLLAAITIISVLLRRWFPALGAEMAQQQKTERLYTELQEAHEELQAAHEARDALTHMIVHDMRTPLTNVISGLQTVQLVEPESPLATELVEGALTGANRLLEMVNDLLDISKMESGEMSLNRQHFPVKAVIDEAITLVDVLVREKNLSLREQIDGCDGADEGVIDADREKVRRILVNLLGNAIKFTPEGGTIRLAVAPTADGMLRLAVTDTGPGIPAEHQARIFDKFYQVDSKARAETASTGLGLTFCKLAVEAQGGHIGVESAPGQGSTFWFTLPCGQVPEPTQAIGVR
jgi:signal transduction histidine kinase